MTDRLVLAGMRFFAYHGVLPEERAQGQEFLVDVELEAGLQNSARRDALELTVDYRRAYEIVKTVMEGEPQNLIETLAETIAAKALALDRVTAVTVRVRKPQVHLPGPLDYSGVEIRRERRQP
ncbi:MAG: dihydroneopterin aldolase [Bacillati bacterium ANGP1]|uniref:7,8-dihydroneopterin aldolase n=1 Tax=Candidatus Segetimicrobium genomatis TaxID=2569760 RepID=A0A537ITK3_9BACT|nr:MAG: dihydroneopterin aldolase [Terrabacteria group bacterium ANGP1]